MSDPSPKPSPPRPRELLAGAAGLWLLAGIMGIAVGVALLGFGWLASLGPIAQVLVAFLLGVLTMLAFVPWRLLRFTRDERSEVRRLTDALRQFSAGNREPLKRLPSDRDDDLGTLSVAIHEALTQVAAHRIEAARLRATMGDTIRRETDRATGRLQREATTDPLTGLGNRRALTEKLQALAEAGRRSGRPLTALLIDIDHFKAINDRLGHSVGDRCLAFLGGVLRSGLRGGDRAYRIGGDEFLVLMPAQGSQIGETVGQRVASLFRQMPWPHDELDQPTVSVGIATASGEDLEEPEEVFRRADEAMYAAKQAGRDRITNYHELRAA